MSWYPFELSFDVGGDQDDSASHATLDKDVILGLEFSIYLDDISQLTPITFHVSFQAPTGTLFYNDNQCLYHFPIVVDTDIGPYAYEISHKFLQPIRTNGRKIYVYIRSTKGAVVTVGCYGRIYIDSKF